jgi:hypothetical protein
MGSISFPAAAAIAAAGEGTADVGAGAAAATAASLAASTAASVAASTAGAATLATGVTAADIAGTAGAAAAAGSTAGLAGGAASIFTLGNVAQAASLIGGAGSAYEKHAQGVALSNDDKMKARQAALQAGQQQINLRQNMLKALASQNNAAGAGGIGTGGSFGANVNRQISQSQNDLLALSSNGSAQTQQYESQAGAALQSGNVGAGASLIDTLGKSLS